MGIAMSGRHRHECGFLPTTTAAVLVIRPPLQARLSTFLNFSVAGKSTPAEFVDYGAVYLAERMLVTAQNTFPASKCTTNAWKSVSSTGSRCHVATGAEFFGTT